MKKKFWIGILTAVLLLNLLPGMTPSAAADDTQSRETFYHECPNYKCRQVADLEIIGYVWKRAGYQLNDKQHWLHVLCPICKEKGYLGGEDHIGGTGTPTCTTGKTCEKCGGEYGKLSHDWGDWQSNGDNNTHTRSCQREGCNAVNTANCGGDGTATCVTAGTYTDCGQRYYSGHYFAKPSKYRYNENAHWFACSYCEEGREAENAHYFVQGNMHLKSAATCISNAVYYTNCTICYYKGTDTYVYQWGQLDPNNHDGGTEVKNAKAATCTEKGYTGDTYCKDCNALLSTGTVIPAAGHTGGTATCKGLAVCKVCHKPYGEKDAANHVGGTEVRGKKDATCTAAGYTGDTYCKGCEALLSSGTAIPAAGEHTGGTPTCLRRAKCEVCGERYGDIDRSNHADGCVPEWTVTETEHTQKYSRCGKLLTETGAHTFGDWTVTQEPTESEEGEQERICTVCGCTETEAIPVAEAKANPSPAPAATPEPTAKPAAEPAEPASTGSAWWILLPVGLAGVAVGIGAGIAFRRRKKK